MSASIRGAWRASPSSRASTTTSRERCVSTRSGSTTRRPQPTPPRRPCQGRRPPAASIATSSSPGPRRQTPTCFTTASTAPTTAARSSRSESRRPGRQRYVDFLGASGRAASYRLTAVDANDNESAPSPAVQAATRALSDDELLTMVQEANFRYYWDGAHPNAGMALEIQPGDENLVALGASGFGIMALLVGAERGFVTREAAAERLVKILRFLAKRRPLPWRLAALPRRPHRQGRAVLRAVRRRRRPGGDGVPDAGPAGGAAVLQPRQRGRARDRRRPSPRSGARSSGTGTARRRTATSCTGTGRRGTPFTSAIR